MGETPYSDDTVLMTENEEDLQAFLNAFNTRLNMTKTKSTVITKTIRMPPRNKQRLDRTTLKNQLPTGKLEY